MGYVESNLLNSENVIAKAKIHWAVFISAIVILIPAIVGIIIKTIDFHSYALAVL